MVSQIYIEDIQMFINEVYSDNEPLQDNQIRSKKILNNYCNRIKQDLERLEELENDKLLDQAEKEELERVNAVLKHNLEEKVEVIADLKKENQELKEEINELSKDKLCFEKRCDKLEKAIELLKDMFNINLWVDDMDCYIRIGKCDYLISWEQYGILSEVL